MKRIKLLLVVLATTGYCFAQDFNITISQSFGGLAITKVCPRSPNNNLSYKLLLTGSNAILYELVLSDKYMVMQDFRSTTKVGYNIFFKGNMTYSYTNFKIQKIAKPNSVMEIKLDTPIKYFPVCPQ